MSSGTAAWKQTLWSIVCLPLKAGPSSRWNRELIHSTFTGGDGIVSFVLLYSIVILIPLLLLSLQYMGHHLSERLLEIYFSVMFGVGLIVMALTFVYVCRMSTENDVSEMFRAGESGRCDVRLCVIKLVFVILLGSVALYCFVSNLKHNLYKKASNKETILIVIVLTYELFQAVILSTILLRSIKSKQLLVLWRGYLLSSAHSLFIYNNVGMCIYLLFSEFQKKKEEDMRADSVENFLITMTIENSLFCISVLSEFSPKPHDEEENCECKNIRLPCLDEVSSEGYIVLNSSSDPAVVTDSNSAFLTIASKHILCLIITISIASLYITMLGMFVLDVTTIPEIVWNILDIAQDLLCLSFEIYGYSCFLFFKNNTKQRNLTTDEVLLIVSAIFFFLYWLFEAAPLIHYLNGKFDEKLLTCFRTLLSMIEIYYLITFITNLRRAVEPNDKVDRTFSVGFICLNLAILNISFWFGDCIWQAKNAYQIYFDYYGGSWFYICHSIYSFGIFYSFHCSMLLLEVLHGKNLFGHNLIRS